jgi:hypothetical protein
MSKTLLGLSQLAASNSGARFCPTELPLVSQCDKVDCGSYSHIHRGF